MTLDKAQRQQLHTMAHSDELTCLDVHLKTGVAASAHKGAGQIYACVWEPTTGKVRQPLYIDLPPPVYVSLTYLALVCGNRPITACVSLVSAYLNLKLL